MSVLLFLRSTDNQVAIVRRETLAVRQQFIATADDEQAYVAIGRWRDDAQGPMQVVSGPMGRERVHYEAPPASLIDAEMRAFFAWINDESAAMDPVLRAAIAQRLSREHADLLAVPEVDPSGRRIDWYAPFDGEARRLADLGEAAGAFGRPDPAGEAVPDEHRQIAAVVQVGVGEQHGVELHGRRAERHPVAFAQGLEALEKAGIEQQSLLAHRQQMTRAGDGVGGAEEGEFHGAPRVCMAPDSSTCNVGPG